MPLLNELLIEILRDGNVIVEWQNWDMDRLIEVLNHRCYLMLQQIGHILNRENLTDQERLYAIEQVFEDLGT